MEALNQIPIMTKIWGGGILITGLLVTAQVVSPFHLIFVPQLFFGGQFWRLFTAPFFLGKLDFNLLMSLLTNFMFFKRLEERHYSNRLSTLVFLFILISVLVSVFSGILGSYSISSSMLTAFTYIYSKLYATEMVNFMMVIPIPIAYLPFASILLQLLQQASLKPPIIGIICGHIVFYLAFIHPVLSKRPVLKTPRILQKLLDNREGANQAPRVPNFGRGRRLNE